MGFVHDREGLGQQGFGNLITGCNKVQRWYNPEKEILEHVCVLFSLLFSIISDSSK